MVIHPLNQKKCSKFANVMFLFLFQNYRNWKNPLFLKTHYFLRRCDTLLRNTFDSSRLVAIFKMGIFPYFYGYVYK